MKAEQVLTAQYDVSDEPLQIDRIDGLREAVNRVQETHERELVRCEDRVMNYDVYYNTKTESVRIAAVATLASYEVTQEKDLHDF